MTQPALAAESLRFGVQRWGRVSIALTAFAVALGIGFAFVPLLFGENTVQKATTLLILVLLAVMWNALAGYGGLVSVGQQAFIGLGAYGTVWLCNHNWNPYRAMVVATLFCGLVAIGLSPLVLRFRGAQFAIGMWVVAEAAAILVSLDQSLGAGTGTSLIELNYYTPTQRQHYTYWLTLGLTAFFLTLLFVLLRSRLGASLQAIRDDEEAAASVGVRVLGGKWILFVVAGLGCGAAGAMTLANTLFIEPSSIFGVDWTAYMIFMVIVGGLGTFEGPIIGAVVLFAIQNEFGDNGVWYLVGLGGAAMGFALVLPKGIWGTLEDRFGFRVMPVGYRLRRLKMNQERSET